MFECSNCGTTIHDDSGKCPNCEENTPVAEHYTIPDPDVEPWTRKRNGARPTREETERTRKILSWEPPADRVPLEYAGLKKGFSY
jgi:predicted ATP-dependent serine protease